MFWEKCFCIFHITVFGSLFSCTCIKTLPGVRVPDLCSLPFAFINLIKFHFFFFFSFSCYIVFAICILCFIKPKLGSHLSKCSLKSWRLWGKLVQRAKFSIKFWRCRPGQGRGNNLTTILLHIFKFNEKELVLLSRWPLTLAEPTFVCRTPFSYILRPYWNQ